MFIKYRRGLFFAAMSKARISVADFCDDILTQKPKRLKSSKIVKRLSPDNGFHTAPMREYNEVFKVLFEAPSRSIDFYKPHNWSKIDFAVLEDKVQAIIETRYLKSYNFEVIQQSSIDKIRSLKKCGGSRHAMYMRCLGESNKPDYVTHEMLVGIPATKVKAVDEDEDPIIQTLNELQEEHEKIKAGLLDSEASDDE